MMMLHQNSNTPQITTHELQLWKITEGHAVAKPAGLEFLNSIRDTKGTKNINV
jgi:hypothetical protein